MGKTILLLCLVLSSVQLFGNRKFLPPPTVHSSNIAVIGDGNALHFSWTNGNGSQRLMIARQGAPVASTPVNGVDYNANQNFGSGDQLNPGEFVVFEGTGNSGSVTSLQPGVTYHISIFEFNGTGATTDYLVAGAPVFNATTFSSAPAVQASNVVFSNVGFNNMTISWTPGNGSGAFVVMRANDAVNGVPVDLTFYLANPNFGSGFPVGVAGNFAIYQSRPGLPNSVTVTNLQAGITYHVAVFECNGLFGTYFNTVNPARGSQGTTSRPTVPSGNLAFNLVEGNRMRLNWTNGNGVRRIVVASAGNPVTATPADGVNYTANGDFTLAPELAPGEKVVFNGPGNFTDITGLLPLTTYHFRIYEYIGVGAGIQYLTSSFASGNRSTLTPPATQSTNLIFLQVTGTSFQMDWANGNGTERILVIKAGSPVDADPVDLQVYSGTGVYGEGNEIGNGNFVVFRTNFHGAQIFGVEPGITYHIAIYELNGTSGPVYNTANPLRGSILIPAHPTQAPALGIGSFQQVEANSMLVVWTPGNGTRRLVIARAGNPVTAVPVDGVDYASNTDFNLGQEISAGEKVLYDGTGTSEFFTGFQPATTYYFRIYEFNLVNGTTFYYTAAFAPGLTTTTAPPNSGSSNLAFNTVTSNSVNVTWQGGGGTSKLLLVREGSPVDAEPADFIAYNANSAFGSGDQVGTGNYVVYKAIANNTTVTNLQPGTTYYFALYDFNGNNAPVYFRPGLTGNITLAGPPQEPASQVVVNNITSTSLTLRWINGSGNGRVVLMSEGIPVNQAPVDNVDYLANPVFGSGSELRTMAGNFTVYNGSGDRVTVTNLSAGATYHFSVFEYNRFGINNIQYLTSNVLSGSATTSAALPVTFTDFHAAETGNAIKLDWTTAQEQNSSHFEIQKSASGNDFITAGRVNAAGNSSDPQHYQFTDNDPFDGLSYYRLRQVDKDGRFAYSKTISIRFEVKTGIRKIINPFRNTIFIQFSSGLVPPGSTWRLYDLQGRIVLTRQTSGNIIDEPAARLKPGMYLLEIMVHGKRQTIKLLKTE